MDMNMYNGIVGMYVVGLLDITFSFNLNACQSMSCSTTLVQTSSSLKQLCYIIKRMIKI